MNCDCVKLANDELEAEGHEYRIATSFLIGTGKEQLSIDTYYPGPKKRGRKKPPVLICTYCPFCGKKTT